MRYQSSKQVASVVVVIMTEALGESFSLDEIRNKVFENVAAVPVFVAKQRAKFLTVQKLDKQLLFKLDRARYGDDFVINNRRVQ